MIDVSDFRRQVFAAYAPWRLCENSVERRCAATCNPDIRVLNRKPIAFDKKLTAAVCNAPLPSFPVTVGGTPTGAVGYETGFKETVLSPPVQVTRVVSISETLSPDASSGTATYWSTKITRRCDHTILSS